MCSVWFVTQYKYSLIHEHVTYNVYLTVCLPRREALCFVVPSQWIHSNKNKNLYFRPYLRIYKKRFAWFVLADEAKTCFRGETLRATSRSCVSTVIMVAHVTARKVRQKDGKPNSWIKSGWTWMKIIHIKNPRRFNSVSKFYFVSIWSSTCFGRHTAHHQEPKTALAAYGFSYVEDCWPCSCWTLTASSNYTANNPLRTKNQTLLVQF